MTTEAREAEVKAKSATKAAHAQAGIQKNVVQYFLISSRLSLQRLYKTVFPKWQGQNIKAGFPRQSGKHGTFGISSP
jgi:hypothetical protein